MTNHLRSLLSITLLLLAFDLNGQESLQDKVDKAYQEHLCDCLQRYESASDTELMDATRIDCPRSFSTDTLVNILKRAITAGAIEFPKEKADYDKLGQSLMSKARDNTIISLIDNCALYKRALVALRESTANDFNEAFPITKKYSARKISESLASETPRNRSTSLMSLGTVYQQQGDYDRAMSFYEAAYAVSPRYRIKGFMYLLKDKVSPTQSTSRDRKDVQQEIDKAFIQHHCNCLQEFEKGSAEELLEAYNVKCYERFLLNDFRKMTAGVSDASAPGKTVRELQTEMAIEMLSNTAVSLVDNCGAYRKVVNQTKELDQDKIKFVQTSFSHDPKVLKQEVSGAKPIDQAAAFKFMGIYEESQKNYQTAMELYKLSYQTDPKSRLLAYIRLLEKKIESAR